MVVASSNDLYSAGPEAYSDEWYAFRKFNPERNERAVLMGGSDAAASIGLDPNKGPRELYHRLRGELPPVKETKAMEFGKFAERFNLDWYAEEENAALFYDSPMYLSNPYPYMAVTPDAIRANKVEQIGVEAKASTRFMRDMQAEDVDRYGEPGTDQVPRYIYCQCQQYCVVLGVRQVDVTVLFDGSDRQTYHVPAHEGLMQQLIDGQREMAERVINNDPPEPNWEMPRTRQVLRDVYGLKSGSVITLNQQAISHWNRLEKLKALAKKVDAGINEMNSRLLAELAGCEAGILPGKDIKLERIQVKAKRWTHSDIGEAEKNLGTEKRKAYEFFKAVPV